jgi:hypothetical protein
MHHPKRPSQAPTRGLCQHKPLRHRYLLTQTERVATTRDLCEHKPLRHRYLLTQTRDGLSSLGGVGR